MMHIVRPHPKFQSPSESEVTGLNTSEQESKTQVAPLETTVRPTLISTSTLSVINQVSINSSAISVLPLGSHATSDSETSTPSTPEMIHAITVMAETPEPRLTPVNSSRSSESYLQPYTIGHSTASKYRQKGALAKLPWLECGGGLIAFTIVSGVVALDGLKQAHITPRPTTPINRPNISSLQPSNPPLPTSTPVSQAELINSGRTLPVPTSAMNFPQRLSMGIPNEDINFQQMNRGEAFEKTTTAPATENDRSVTPQQITQQTTQQSTVQRSIATPESNSFNPQNSPSNSPITAQPNPARLQTNPPLTQTPWPENPAFTPKSTVSTPPTIAPPNPASANSTPIVPSQEPAAKSSLSPTSSLEGNSLENDTTFSPLTLKTRSDLSSNSPIILEPNPQSVTKPDPTSTANNDSPEALRVEVSQL